VFLWQFTLLININAFFIVWTHGAAVRQDDWIWLMQLSPGNAYNFCVHVQRSSFFQKTDWMMLGICSPFCPCYLFSLLSCFTFFRACQEVSRSCCLTFSLFDFMRCIILNVKLAAIIMLEVVFANGWVQDNYIVRNWSKLLGIGNSLLQLSYRYFFQAN